LLTIDQENNLSYSHVRRLRGLANAPPKVRWGTAYVYIPQYLGNTLYKVYNMISRWYTPIHVCHCISEPKSRND